MVNWEEGPYPMPCEPCKGTGWTWGRRPESGTLSEKASVKCLDCNGAGIARQPIGPVDAIEEECTRG